MVRPGRGPCGTAAALASGGQTLVSGVTAGLVGQRLSTALGCCMGSAPVSGIERPEEVWELVSVDDPRVADGRDEAAGWPVPLTRFVGRTTGENFERLVQLTANERLVTLIGQAGAARRLEARSARSRRWRVRRRGCTAEP